MQEQILRGALELAARGYKVFPIGANKQPSVSGGFYAATDRTEVIEQWAAEGRLKNIGLPTGFVTRLVVTDADTEEKAEELRAKYGEPTVESNRGAHWYWLHPGFKVASKPLGDGVDSKADGGYVLAPPSTGKSWVDGIPSLDSLRPIPEELLPKATTVQTQTDAIPEERFEAAVQVLAENYPQPGDRYEAGRHLAGYLMGNGVSEEDAYNLMLEGLNRLGEVDSTSAYNIGRVTETTAAKLAAGEHVTGGPSVEEYAPGLPRKLAAALEWGDKRYPLTDAGNAERFVDYMGADFRFVREWNKWVKWDGRRWGETFEGPIQWGMVAAMRDILVEAAKLDKESDEHKRLVAHALASQNGSRIDAAVKLARGLLAVSVDSFDQHPTLLNVENGVIDLCTGELRPHNRDAMLTAMAPVVYNPKAKAPRFMKFLKQTLVDDELIAFVQRFLGYSLTGLTDERALAVLHGVGKNGKSTLVELFLDLLGDYGGTAHPDTVMRARHSDTTAQYQLAELKGVRFVSISETKRGVELEESTVKQITGNDTISARAPYGKPFTYRPQFKLWMSTNHKPEIPDGSEAIWDRMRLIPFAQRFDGKNADPKLPAKLREELPGVLAWAVRGCVEWMQHGLGTSKAVEKATAEYREETDVLDRFFADECVFGPEARVTKKALFEAWEKWCAGEGEDEGKQNAFTRAMKERGVVRGFREGKVAKERGWHGIGLKGGPEERGVVSSPNQWTSTTPPSENGKNSPSEKSVPSQKSCKEGGVVDPRVHFSEDEGNFSTETPRVEGFENPAKKCPPDEKVSPRSETFEIEGVEWTYIPREES